jgi:hypothetical protein
VLCVRLSAAVFGAAGVELLVVAVFVGNVLIGDTPAGDVLVGGGLRFTTLLIEDGFPAGMAELDGTTGVGGTLDAVGAGTPTAAVEIGIGVVPDSDGAVSVVDGVAEDWYGAGVPTPVALVMELFAKGEGEADVEARFIAGAATPMLVALAVVAGPTASEPRVFAVRATSFCEPCFCKPPALFWSALLRDNET